MLLADSLSSLIDGGNLESEVTSVMSGIARNTSPETQVVLSEHGWNGSNFRAPLTRQDAAELHHSASLATFEVHQHPDKSATACVPDAAQHGSPSIASDLSPDSPVQGNIGVQTNFTSLLESQACILDLFSNRARTSRTMMKISCSDARAFSNLIHAHVSDKEDIFGDMSVQPLQIDDVVTYKGRRVTVASFAERYNEAVVVYKAPGGYCGFVCSPSEVRKVG